VSGCTSVVDGEVQHPDDPHGQLLVALGTAAAALAELGLGLDDVVRTRMYLVDAADQDEVGRAHRDLLGHVRPAATMVVVAGLVHPAMRVEVEVDAYRDRG
jgi:enamine deaminase RidA (YjgF/YER057c/UK114 family)